MSDISDIEIPQDEDEQDEGGSSVTRFVPWLIIVALALLFAPLYFGSVAIADDTGPLSTELADLQATLTAPPQVPMAEQTLSAQVLDLRSDYGVIGNLPPKLVAGHVDWPGIMATIHRYDANQIRLTGFVNESSHLMLNGEAIQESSVLEYVSMLQDSGFFAQVSVQSITMSIVASPTPNLEPTMTGPAPLSPIYMPFIFTLSIEIAEAGSGLR